MARQVGEYFAQIGELKSPDEVPVMYQITDTDDPRLAFRSTMMYTLVPGNTVTVERAAIVAAIKVKEGIS